jgi:hypothetical protein
MIWHNKEKESQRIPIESIRFDYEIVKPRHGDEQDHLLPMQSDAPTAHPSEQISQIQTSLAEMLKYLRWISKGVVVIAILIVIFMIKH